MTLRQDKIIKILKQISASFIEEEANSSPLITVTNANISSDMKNATIFFTTLPEDKEAAALLFLSRKEHALRERSRKQLKNMRVLPYFKFEIDKGERNRQKIDELLR